MDRDSTYPGSPDKGAYPRFARGSADHVSQALNQIAEIHQQLARSEIYRGYRSIPLAASGLAGIAGAWWQPRGLTGDPIAFTMYWIAIALCAGFVGGSEILYNYTVYEDAPLRRRTRLVVGQFLPGLLTGGIVTLCFARLGAVFVALLPGMWALCFGLGTFASRPYLPRATGWVALWYGAAGVWLLWHATDPLSGWRVGGTFAVGQLLAALVLWWNLERAA